MSAKSILIRVPASVGSFAGALDCAAVALDATLNVQVTQRFDGRVTVRYFGERAEYIPRDRSNLVVQAMEAALHARALEFPGADFGIYSSVPVGVGLGSSTAAVLAGLIAADRLYHLQLDEKKIFELASIYDNRTDCLRAAWFGGFVAAADAGSHRQSVVQDRFVLDVVIPDTPLAKSVPGLDEALKVKTSGLLGVFLCGSGPAVGILEGELSDAVKLVQECFSRNGIESRHVQFRASNFGARDLNVAPQEVGLPRLAALSPPDKKISLIPV